MLEGTLTAALRNCVVKPSRSLSGNVAVILYTDSTSAIASAQTSRRSCGRSLSESRITNHESRRDRRQLITNNGWSNSTGWPLSPRMLSTVPETSASIGLNIFMASMMPRVSPALTDWPTVTNAGLSGAGEL